MKRLLTIALALTMLLCILTGCGRQGQPVQEELSTAVTSEAAASETATEVQEPADEALKITALSVGSADALLIEADGHTMLLDTGEAQALSTISGALADAGIDHLDVLLITHYDKDHVGSAAALLRQIPVDTILYPDYRGSRQEYYAFMQVVQECDGAKAVSEVTELMLGSARLTVYPAEKPEKIMKKESEYDNDLSLVTCLTYGDCSFLFAGDIEELRIEELLKNDLIQKCDWIKMPHHGRYEDNLKGFLKAADPSYAVITDSAAEPADEDTLKLLKKRSVSWASTADGSVVTSCDGTTITMG